MPTLAEEIQRIVDIPTVPQPDEAWGLEFSKAMCPASAWTDPNFKGLFLSQAHAIASYVQYNAVFGLIPAGQGKTNICYKVADIAYMQKGHRRILILTTNAVYPQFVGHGHREALKYVGVGCPIIPLHGKTPAQRMAMVTRYETGAFVMPYSYLSQPDSAELLDAIFPTCLIADEAHRLKEASTGKAAGPRRLFETLFKVEQHFKMALDVCLLSGTMSNKGLYDFWFLSKASLQENSPIPRSEYMAKQLGEFIDSTADDGNIAGNPVAREAMSLVTWSNRYWPEQALEYNVVGMRKAMDNRLVSTPGVVRTSGKLCDSAISIDIKKGPKMNKACADFMKGVKAGKAPNGEEIEYGIHQFKWNYELASGFYNDLFWDEDKYPAHILDAAKEQHAANQEYLKIQRKFLEYYPERGMDTPLLLHNHMLHHGAKGVDPELYHAWKEQHELRFEGMPKRSKRPIYVSTHRIDQVITFCKAFAKKHKSKRMIVWCHNMEFRRWLFESMFKEGLNVQDVPAGNSHLLPSYPEDCPFQFSTASATAYQEGLNLQWGHHACYAQAERSAKVWEQTMARQHRSRQPEDECFVTMFSNSEFDDVMLSATLSDAVYVQQTLGTQMRSVIAAYSTPPKIYPRALMVERCPDIKKLTPEMEALFLSQFST